MTIRTRLLVAVAAVALAMSYVAPLWRIDLEAPQYPEGIGMRIWAHTITGASEYDLRKINQLNHYIGMKAIEPDSIRELDLMPWVIGLLILGALAVAAAGRRWLLYVWVGLFALCAAGGLVDFWLWEYDYGHDLDPTAAIRIPGMSYQPPLIGSRQILNFTAHSWPAAGGWAAIAAFAIAAGVLLRERGRHSARLAGLAAAGVLTVGIAACSPGPEPIRYGADRGAYCGMVISDQRYGAELVTRRGRVHKFDSVECLAGYVLTRVDSSEIHSLWVTDFNDPPTLIRVETAFFLESRDLRTPMGGNLTAFGPGITHAAVRNAFFGEVLAWPQVLERARRGLAAAGPHVHAPAGASSEVAGDDVASDSVLHVSPAGPIRSIGAAVAAARPGARIIVEAGVYREPTIVVNRPLEIAARGQVVLDGDGERQLVVIRADDVRIRGLTFRNVGTSFVEDRSAIRVEQARGCRIENNRFEDTFFGIYLASAADCVIEGNVLIASRQRETAAGNGIHLWYSKNVVIRGNRIEGHRDGIYFEFVRNSLVESNRAEGNLRYGLHFMFSDSCRYLGNRFSDNGAGVAVMYAKHVQMRDNVFERNWGNAAFALLLKDIRDSRIERNTLRGNSVGIYAEGVNRTRVEGNRFEENGWAVKIMANALDNVFRHNTFVRNTFDVATNSRKSYSTFEENYWDAYDGYDLDRDGYGDVPFRPVRLFALIVERNEPSLILLRSLLVDALDAAERIFPVLTPETLADARPLMQAAHAGARPLAAAAGAR